MYILRFILSVGAGLRRVSLLLLLLLLLLLYIQDMLLGASLALDLIWYYDKHIGSSLTQITLVVYVETLCLT